MASFQKSELLDAPVSYALAKSVRSLCMAAAWHTANVRAGFDRDAQRDMRELKAAVEETRKLVASPDGAVDMLEKMVLSIAWHAANTRKNFKEDAAANLVDFEKHQACLVEAAALTTPEPGAAIADGCLTPDAVELIANLATTAAWFAANTRKNFARDAARDAAQLSRTFNCLFVKRRPKWLGVNLGGWLLLERGPSEPFFEDQNAPGDEEWAFCQLMRQRGHAEEVFEAHRSKHFVEDDIVRMKALGLNAVRVPFGYWCVTGPTEGDAYVGPCLHHLDNVVAWCEKHGLQVLLDLHGNPGGESSEKPCGRSLKGWHFGTWRRGEALNCLKIVAHRYKDFACVAGLQVANETGRLVDPKKLVDHYADCAKVIREAGMSPERVAVVCPYYFFNPPIGTPQRTRFLQRWRERSETGDLDHCVMDLHYYHFSDYDREALRGPIGTQVVRFAAELDSLPAAVVGEYSACPPPGCSVDRTEFFAHQLQAYHKRATHGLFFWCWKDGAGEEWGLEAFLKNDPTRAQLLMEEAHKYRPPELSLEVNYEDVMAKTKLGSDGKPLLKVSSSTSSNKNGDGNNDNTVVAASSGSGASGGGGGAVPPPQRPSYWDSLKDGYLSEKMAAVRAARMREAARQGKLGAQEEEGGDEVGAGESAATAHNRSATAPFQLSKGAAAAPTGAVDGV